MQLAETLRKMGANQAAKAVDFARYEHRNRTRNSPWKKGFDAVLKWGAGYGVYPSYALIPFSILVAVGWLGTYWSRGLQYANFFSRGLYSLCNSIPLIDWAGPFSEVNHGENWVTYCFYFQKIIGFALATILISALTLLGS